MEEIWKPIIITKNGVTYDYTGLYEISNMGRVRSLDRVDAGGNKIKGKILSTRANHHGYLQVVLCKDGKRKSFSVHRLVATMFIPNPDNLPFVNHRDENKTNAVWTNLEWCTAKYNTQYSWNTDGGKKRKQERTGSKNPMYGRKGNENPNSKKVICIETKQVFNSITLAKEWLGKGNVADCLNGRCKTAGGYHWMYYEDYLAQQENVEPF